LDFLKKLLGLSETKPTPQNYTRNKSTPQKYKRGTTSNKPSYSGPLFAQPGEVSSLFGYANYKNGEVLDALFTIIDIETSSLTPKDGFIIEVGINQIDKNGKIIKEFSSLVNPPDGRVGRTDVHGIRPSDLKDAPSFNDLMGDLLDIFQDSIIVAHNARFEERFLKAEFTRNKVKLPVLPALDTLWLSRQVINLQNYKLATVVGGYGKRIVNAHTALGDTRAVSKILPLMLEKSKPLKFPTNFARIPIVEKKGIVKPR
jgi:DNA polymerase-3 subunit epsilon